MLTCAVIQKSNILPQKRISTMRSHSKMSLILVCFFLYFLGYRIVYTADHCLACSACLKISFIFTVRLPEAAQVAISFDSLLSQYLHLPSLLKAIPQKQYLSV